LPRSSRVYAHVLRDQAVEVARVFAAMVDQPVDSDQLVAAKKQKPGPMRSRTARSQAADLRVWLPG